MSRCFNDMQVIVGAIGLVSEITENENSELMRIAGERSDSFCCEEIVNFCEHPIKVGTGTFLGTGTGYGLGSLIAYFANTSTLLLPYGFAIMGACLGFKAASNGIRQEKIVKGLLHWFRDSRQRQEITDNMYSTYHSMV